MIALDRLSKALQIALGDVVTTSQLQWEVSFSDDDAWGSKDGLTNNTTRVDMCTGIQGTPSPTIYGVRKVANVSVFNADTVAQSVSIIYFNGTTSTTIVEVTLDEGYTLHYDTDGWYVTDTSGRTVIVEISVVALPALADGKIWVGDAANVATERTPSGDATISNTGVVTVVSASETTAGKIEIATQTEYNTGTDDTRAVTPLKAKVGNDLRYQPLDSDLTAIAGLSPSNDDIIQRKSGAWTNRTMAQLWADLILENNAIDFSGTANPTGFSSSTVNFAMYYDLGSVAIVELDVIGTSNATTLTITLPFTAIRVNFESVRVQDNGAFQATSGLALTTGAPTTTVSFGKTLTTTGGFTALNTKRIQCTLIVSK